MNFDFIVGIDISKTTLDATLLHHGQQTLYESFDNQKTAIKRFIKKIHKKFDAQLGDILFVMEFTDTYNDHLVEMLENMEAPIWICSALHIIKSGGLQRGKNDKVDSLRIAQFAFRNFDQFRAHIPMRKELKEIRRLFTVRRNLVKSRKQILGLTADYDFIKPQVIDNEQHAVKVVLTSLAQQIKTIEKEIKFRILNDHKLSRYFMLITSVKGIAFVTAVKILITTNEFKKFRQPKVLACHAGIVPFDHISGTSIKKLPRVSPLADKELKALLHMYGCHVSYFSSW